MGVLGKAADVLSRELKLPEVPFSRIGSPYDSLGRKAYDTKLVAEHITFIARQTGTFVPPITVFDYSIIARTFQSLLNQLVAAGKIPDNLF